MENNENQAPVEQASEAAAPKEKKPRKMKKMKREDFIVAQIKSGQRDAAIIATLLGDAASKGELQMKKTRKIELSLAMWFGQVKWYFHQAKKKGLVDGDLILPAREKKVRQKKEKVPAQEAAAPAVEAPAEQPAAPAETQEAPAAEETLGSL